MEEAKWYVAHTFSGYENKVASNIETVVENRNLHDWIQDVVVPTETVVEIKDDGTKKEVERKIFPGYVLIKMVMNDDSWYEVTVEVHYAVGDLVNVIDGPLEGFSGTVDAIDIPNNSAQVTVSMFGRETSVDFELDQLEKVKD